MMPAPPEQQGMVVSGGTDAPHAYVLLVGVVRLPPAKRPLEGVACSRVAAAASQPGGNASIPSGCLRCRPDFGMCTAPFLHFFLVKTYIFPCEERSGERRTMKNGEEPRNRNHETHETANHAYTHP